MGGLAVAKRPRKRASWTKDATRHDDSPRNLLPTSFRSRYPGKGWCGKYAPKRPRSLPVTRLLLSMRFLTVAGAVALVACGPRLKPIEYEEPKLSGSGAPDDNAESVSGGPRKSKSASHGDESSSSSGSSSSASTGKGGHAKTCDDKTSPCGSPCTECPPGDLECMEVLIEKQCNLEKKCVPAPVDCTAPEKSDKDKKAGKKK
jgi:hypothetical protein